MLKAIKMQQRRTFELKRKEEDKFLCNLQSQNFKWEIWISYKRGFFTFIKELSSNVLDYALASEGIINNILDFNIGEEQTYATVIRIINI